MDEEDETKDDSEEYSPVVAVSRFSEGPAATLVPVTIHFFNNTIPISTTTTPSR
jgi:hypothetical protein